MGHYFWEILKSSAHSVLPTKRLQWKVVNTPTWSYIEPLLADRMNILLNSSIMLVPCYYPVYCPSFPRQGGLDSATCLGGLIAFLHLLWSWAKEVDNRSLVRSISNVVEPFFLSLGGPEGSYHLLRNLRSF